MTDEASIPHCPACHHVCRLDHYMCMRGTKFHEMWERGEEVPPRRMPPRGGRPPKGSDMPEFTTTMRIEMGMRMVPRMIKGKAKEGKTESLLETYARREGGMLLQLAAMDMESTATALQPTIEAMLAKGLVEEYVPYDGATMHRLTEAGKQAHKEQQERHSAAREEFFSVLNDEEQQQLADLLEKAFRSQPRPPRPEKKDK